MSAGRSASFHARLLNLAKSRGDDFNLILNRCRGESFTVAIPRDTLLPKLISGEVRLRTTWAGGKV